MSPLAGMIASAAPAVANTASTAALNPQLISAYGDASSKATESAGVAVSRYLRAVEPLQAGAFGFIERMTAAGDRHIRAVLAHFNPRSVVRQVERGGAGSTLITAVLSAILIVACVVLLIWVAVMAFGRLLKSGVPGVKWPSPPKLKLPTGFPDITDRFRRALEDATAASKAVFDAAPRNPKEAREQAAGIVDRGKAQVAASGERLISSISDVRLP